ncbi:MAG: hypothetical protein OEU46_12455, partial [Alphaproteobacteria bacterium]|nr:hypothetical protein [Alphaproteobacteria bacterium]
MIYAKHRENRFGGPESIARLVDAISEAGLPNYCQGYAFIRLWLKADLPALLIDFRPSPNSGHSKGDIRHPPEEGQQLFHRRPNDPVENVQ